MRYITVLLLGLLTACGTIENNTDSAEYYTFNEEVTCEEACGHKGKKALICHLPPGNPENSRTLCVSQKSVKKYIAHDKGECGPCPEPAPECGDQTCQAPEDCKNCPLDCGECPTEPDPGPYCGDGECADPEVCDSCFSDCGVCPLNPPNEAENTPEREAETEQTVTGGGGCNTSANNSPLGLALFIMLLAYIAAHKPRFLLVTLMLCSHVAVVSAQVPGDPSEVALERFEMPMDNNGILNVESGNVPFQGSWGMNVWMGYANDPLVVNQRAVGSSWIRSGSLVGDQFSASIGGFIVPHEKLALGLRLPVTLDQRRDKGSLTGLRPLSNTGLGDATLMGKYQFLEQEEGSLLDLAAGVNMSIPTHSENSYMGESFISATPYIAATRWVGSWTISANLGARIREKHDIADLRVGNEVFTRLGISYGFGKNELQASLTGFGGLKDLGKGNSNYLEGMLGYQRHLGDGMSIFLGLGRGLDEGFGSPDWRAFAGFRAEIEGAAPVNTCWTCKEKVVVPNSPQKKTKEVKEERPPTSQEQVLVIPDAFFLFDSSTLTPAGVAELAALAPLLQDKLNAGKEFRVVAYGHTDSIGSSKYNMNLGESRAWAVIQVLVDNGLDPEVTTVITMGENNPVATNRTAEGRARNRRVEIKIAPKDAINWEGIDQHPDSSYYDNLGVR